MKIFSIALAGVVIASGALAAARMADKGGYAAAEGNGGYAAAEGNGGYASYAAPESGGNGTYASYAEPEGNGHIEHS